MTCIVYIKSYSQDRQANISNLDPLAPRRRYCPIFKTYVALCEQTIIID